MIRSIVMHDIPISLIAPLENYYTEHHGPEIARRYGPWLSRLESFSPVLVPPEAQAYGFYNWRVTDGWWRDMPERGHKGTFTFTIPLIPPRVATCFIPAQPTEDFKGWDVQPHEKYVLRWFIIFKYPDGVDKAEADDWFLNIHVKEACQQEGLYRYFSYKVIKEPNHLPGTWPPQWKSRAVGPTCWDRVCEMWYETFEDWKKSVIDSPPQYTKPGWAKYDKYPFLEPYVDFCSSWLLKRPVNEFLRDARGYD